MDNTQKYSEKALRAAQMYYYQNLPMKKIAAELEVSASTVSRLLTWARERGLVEIRINDLHGRASSLEELIKVRYQIASVTVVPVPETASDGVRLERVTRVAANYLGQVMKSGMVLGLAWGRTVSQVASYLTPKLLVNSHVVQLNGGDAIRDSRIPSAVELVTQCADNFSGVPHLFHLPTCFDSSHTREAVWQERSMQRTLDWHQRIEVALFSVGTFVGDPLSALYISDYLQPSDYAEIQANGVIGDIANMFIRADGTFADIDMNGRACGPDLQLLKKADRSICVVSGHNKLGVIHAALTNRFVTDLILDESTARRLAESRIQNL